MKRLQLEARTREDEARKRDETRDEEMKRQRLEMKRESIFSNQRRPPLIDLLLQAQVILGEKKNLNGICIDFSDIFFSKKKII